MNSVTFDSLIRSFRDRVTADLFYGAPSVKLRKVSPDVITLAQRKLAMVDSAARRTDLRVPPNNRLKALKGPLAGYYSIRVNDQWRVVFRWEANGAHDVWFCDYH